MSGFSDWLARYLTGNVKKDAVHESQFKDFWLNVFDRKSRLDFYNNFNDNVLKKLEQAELKIKSSLNSVKSLKVYALKNNLKVRDLDYIEVMLECYLNGFQPDVKSTKILHQVRTTRYKASKFIRSGLAVIKGEFGKRGTIKKVYSLDKTAPYDVFEPESVLKGQLHSFVGGLVKSGWSETVFNGFTGKVFNRDFKKLLLKDDASLKDFKRLMTILREVLAFCAAGVDYWGLEFDLDSVKFSGLVKNDVNSSVDALFSLWDSVKGKHVDSTIRLLTDKDVEVAVKLPNVYLGVLKPDSECGFKRNGVLSYSKTSVVGVPFIVDLGSPVVSKMLKSFKRLKDGSFIIDCSSIGLSNLNGFSFVVFNGVSANRFFSKVFGIPPHAPFMVLLPNKLNSKSLVLSDVINVDYLAELKNLNSISALRKLIDDSGVSDKVLYGLLSDFKDLKDYSGIVALYNNCVRFVSNKNLKKLSWFKQAVNITNKTIDCDNLLNSNVKDSNVFGLLISAMINIKSLNNYEITCSRKINYLGYGLKSGKTLTLNSDFTGDYLGALNGGGEIIVKGGVKGDYLGFFMNGGTINFDAGKKITGNHVGFKMSGKAVIKAENIVGNLVGSEMKGDSKIEVNDTIKGDDVGFKMSGKSIIKAKSIVGDGVGDAMTGGEIIVNDKIDGNSVGVDMRNGKITANNIVGDAVGNSMTDGEITVTDTIKGKDVGFNMKGGEITADKIHYTNANDTTIDVTNFGGTITAKKELKNQKTNITKKSASFEAKLFGPGKSKGKSTLVKITAVTP